MGVWRSWATAANYVMCMPPVTYWAFQSQPFPLTEGSPGSNPGHDSISTLSKLFCSHCMIAHNKHRPETHPSTVQVQNVKISPLNQNAYTPTSFPDLPKIDLASFKKSMVMINALFRTHPENYCDNTQKVIMVAAQLKDNTREVFLNLLEEDPSLIFFEQLGLLLICSKLQIDVSLANVLYLILCKSMQTTIE
ncbi:hypothetical protein DSO57_1008439 [Entomophthora muscae]|uniref:Uncharacterized protein n=1 Tax=Entomophthora muscae TaxID=34485 RepID=A0ACC2T724_9FUNG|nr:hypothetical protein DSO57_1008439 [Entomophthora muscae]